MVLTSDRGGSDARKDDRIIVTSVLGAAAGGPTGGPTGLSGLNFRTGKTCDFDTTNLLLVSLVGRFVKLTSFSVNNEGADLSIGDILKVTIDTKEDGYLTCQTDAEQEYKFNRGNVELLPELVGKQVKVTESYNGGFDGHITLNPDDIIKVTEELDCVLLKGENIKTGTTGVFPRKNVELILSLLIPSGTSSGKKHVSVDAVADPNHYNPCNPSDPRNMFRVDCGEVYIMNNGELDSAQLEKVKVQNSFRHPAIISRNKEIETEDMIKLDELPPRPLSLIEKAQKLFSSDKRNKEREQQRKTRARQENWLQTYEEYKRTGQGVDAQGVDGQRGGYGSSKSKRRTSRRGSSNLRLSKRRLSKRRLSNHRLSKRRLSKRRLSKRRPSKRKRRTSRRGPK